VQNGLLYLDMIPSNEMPKYDMAHSIDATNGGLEDINMYDCDYDCRGLSEVGFDDQALWNGLLEDITMLDDEIGPSPYYGTSPHMVTHETNQAPMCPTHETPFPLKWEKSKSQILRNGSNRSTISCYLA
jgi:hypothetical protein